MNLPSSHRVKVVLTLCLFVTASVSATSDSTTLNLQQEKKDFQSATPYEPGIRNLEEELSRISHLQKETIDELFKSSVELGWQVGTKFTPAKQKRFIDALSRVLYYEQAVKVQNALADNNFPLAVSAYLEAVVTLLSTLDTGNPYIKVLGEGVDLINTGYQLKNQYALRKQLDELIRLRSVMERTLLRLQQKQRDFRANRRVNARSTTGEKAKPEIKTGDSTDKMFTLGTALSSGQGGTVRGGRFHIDDILLLRELATADHMPSTTPPPPMPPPPMPATRHTETALPPSPAGPNSIIVTWYHGYRPAYQITYEGRTYSFPAHNLGCCDWNGTRLQSTLNNFNATRDKGVPPYIIHTVSVTAQRSRYNSDLYCVDLPTTQTCPSCGTAIGSSRSCYTADGTAVH